MMFSLLSSSIVHVLFLYAHVLFSNFHFVSFDHQKNKNIYIEAIQTVNHKVTRETSWKTKLFHHANKCVIFNPGFLEMEAWYPWRLSVGTF